MIKSGSVNVYVSDMDRAIKFYTDVLGMKLIMNAGGHYAQIAAGGGLVLGLHPASPQAPKPGTRGSISIGLAPDRPLDQAVAELTKRGVAFRGPVVNDPPVQLAFFGDPDGNELYLVEFKAPQ
ncbi:MAG TPA: VOC family protein [Phycisphaerae bacterium]|nr:VOC family protein [Phycisphaerae bacterium]